MREHTLQDALHEATHRLPGIPPHHDQPAGHQRTSHRGRAAQNRPARGRLAQNSSTRNQAAQNQGTRHHGTRHHGTRSPHANHNSPRVLVSWQNWIAGLFERAPR